MKKILAIVSLALVATGCTNANKEVVQQNAAATFKQAGFEIVGYEGWQRGKTSPLGDGGAYVWYTLKRVPDTGVTYHAAIQEWDGEYHIYNLRAIDAITPN